MEDILASIRRILNEDEAGRVAREPVPPAPPRGRPRAEEPLDLTREMLVGDPPAAARRRRCRRRAAPPPAAAPAAAEPPPRPAAARRHAARSAARRRTDALLAPAAAAAASASLGSLLRAVAAERGSARARSGGPTIEDVVREELRPLLKEWLDQHLPGGGGAPGPGRDRARGGPRPVLTTPGRAAA